VENLRGQHFRVQGTLEATAGDDKVGGTEELNADFFKAKSGKLSLNTIYCTTPKKLCQISNACELVHVLAYGQNNQSL
jgi:hypothetical protein